ncbi:hypothetical protein KHQ81_08260 [Mycoplasmatota bacterium]|nr:hypothetical protein KHQ81_08260 [Mycoplasmatota bacterium]
MNTELIQKKILFYSAAYMTNVNYLIILILLSVYIEVDKDLYLTLTLWGVPALISILSSYFIIRKNILNNLSREHGILRITIAHVPSLLGLIVAFIYLFVL